MRTLLVASFRDSSGYSTISRHFLTALRSYGMDITARSIDYDDGPRYVFSPEDEECFQKPLKDIDCIFQFTTPNEQRYRRDKMNVAMVFWETTSIPPYWVDQLNKLDLLIAPCEFNAITFKLSGVKCPIVVSYPMFDMSKYECKPEPLDIPELKDRYVFYNICQISPKKGIDALLKAYLTGFLDVPDQVVLLLKTYVNMANRQNEEAQIRGFIESIKKGLRIPTKKWPPIYLMTDIQDEKTIDRIHGTGHCYVNAARGEGFCEPLFSAMAYGNLAVSNPFGGVKEYVNEQTALLYGGQMSPVYDMYHPDPVLYTAVENWFEPNIIEMRQQMRIAFQNKPTFKPNLSHFDYSVIAPRLISLLDNSYGLLQRDGKIDEMKLNLQSKTVEIR